MSDINTILNTHCCLEIASLRQGVKHELKSTLLLVQGDSSQLQTVIGLVDNVVRREAADFIAFITLLVQGTSAAIDGVAPTVHKLVANRAALLQVRLALDQGDLPVSTPVTESAASMRSEALESTDKSPTRAYSSTGNDQVYERDMAGRSRLCLHALETLKGSVQTRKQLPGDANTSTDAAYLINPELPNCRATERRSSPVPSGECADTATSHVVTQPKRLSWDNSTTMDVGTEPRDGAIAGALPPASKWNLARSLFLGRGETGAQASVTRRSARQHRRATIRCTELQTNHRDLIEICQVPYHFTKSRP